MNAKSVIPAAIALLISILPGCGKEPDRQPAVIHKEPGRTEKAVKGTYRPDIVLVVLDTVRKDFTYVGGNSHATPALESLAKTSTVFRNTWSNSTWTVPSHASMFTGMIPSEHNVTSHNYYLAKKPPTLAGILSENGYETAAFFSNPWLSHESTGLMRGFDQHTEIKYLDKEKASRIRGDQGGIETNNSILRFLDSRKKQKPMFLFVNYLEAHSPYDPPPAYRGRYITDVAPEEAVSERWLHRFNSGLYPFNTVDFKTLRRLYQGDVHTADERLGELMAMLNTNSPEREKIIIVTSDHGENLGEENLVGHQFAINEALLSVPLIIMADGTFEKGADDRTVMLSDLFLTILDMAGVKEKPLRGFSRSLLCTKGSGCREKPEPGRITVSEYAGGSPRLIKFMKKLNPDLNTSRLRRAYRSIRMGKWRLTVADNGTRMLHDLEMDPLQKVNVFNREETVAGNMMKHMLRIQKTRISMGGPADSGPPPLSSEVKKRLRSLGYVQ